MILSRSRWMMIALLGAVFGMGVLGLLVRWNSQRQAGDHVAWAQKAWDEANKHRRNILLTSERIKKSRKSSDRSRYEAILKTSRHKLARLEETAMRHERLAREYGYQGSFDQQLLILPDR